MEMGRRAEHGVSPFLRDLGLFLAKFCSSAWVGAASLFVVVGVTEVTRGGFDSVTKDTLVAIRFPAFYWFGFTLVGIAWLGTWFAGPSGGLSSARRVVALAALMAVLSLMVIDYVAIYRPLLNLVTPPGQTRGPSFVSYHEASKWINFAGLAICLIAVLAVNWPVRDGQSADEGIAKQSV